MRIALVTDTWEPARNGVVASISRLRGELSRTGHDVVLLAPSPDGGGAPGAFRSVPTPEPELRLALVTRAAIDRTLRRIDPDIVHVHTPGPLGWMAASRARRGGRRVVASWHTDLMSYASVYRWIGAPFDVASAACRGGNREPAVPLIGRLTQRWLDHADAVVVPSAKVADAVRAWSGGPVAVIPSGAPSVSRARSPTAPADAATVLFVGRISAEKNFALLSQAVRHAARTIPALRLVAIGRRRGRHGERCVRAAGIRERTLFAGQMRREDVLRQMASATVLACPSLTETEGLVVNEAASVGLPSVVVDPMVPYCNFVPGRSGVLCAPTASSMGDGLVGVLADARRHAALRVGALEAAATWTSADHASALVRLYEDRVR